MLQDCRKRPRQRWIPQLGLILLLALYRIWISSHHIQQQQQLQIDSTNAASRHLLSEPPTNTTTSNAGHQCRKIHSIPTQHRCHHSKTYCRSSRSVVNYISLHFCTLDQTSWLSVPLLLALLLISFLYLAETAESFFSPIARLMVELLNMSPTMGGVTLLALGNGAPDVFASMAAIGGGNSRIGLGAIISAGTFVSGFVVGCVALVAAPFGVRAVSFVRDLLFYTAAVGLVFVMYMKGVATFWWSVGLVVFYVVFIVAVLVMDQVKSLGDDGYVHAGSLKNSSPSTKSSMHQLEGPVLNDGYADLFENSSLKDVEESHKVKAPLRATNDDGYLHADNSSLHKVKTALQAPTGYLQAENSSPDWKSANLSLLHKVRALLQAPLHAVLRATIPEVDASKWTRFNSTANIIFCPLLLLFMFRSVISLDHHVVVFHPALRLPLWCLVLFQNVLLALAYFVFGRPSAESSQIPVAFLAFVMSVFWISFIAGELVGCLTALGVVLGLSPALLGLTVLAWGNSMGDLVADIAIARAGKPEMAIAGCFAGPMFNMLVGLGSALVLHTSYVEPAEYYLPYHPSITIAFGFLFTSLLSTLFVVVWFKFRVTRLWGLCLIALYAIFTLTTACHSLIS